MMQEFTQAIKDSITAMMQDIHTVIPGQIISFDPDKCEASILPTGKFKLPNGKFMNFPQLNNVPVYIMQGGGQTASIVYPIKPNDGCLLFVSEQSLDVWRFGSASDTDLRFDLSSAIALVGLFQKANPLAKKAVEKDAVIIAMGNTEIMLLSDNKVEIVGDVSIKGDLSVSGEFIN